MNDINSKLGTPLKAQHKLGRKEKQPSNLWHPDSNHVIILWVHMLKMSIYLIIHFNHVFLHFCSCSLVGHISQTCIAVAPFIASLLTTHSPIPPVHHSELKDQGFFPQSIAFQPQSLCSVFDLGNPPANKLEMMLTCRFWIWKLSKNKV